MALDPYLRLMKRLIEIHHEKEGLCAKCGDPIPCETMRGIWIYDLETQPQDGGR